MPDFPEIFRQAGFSQADTNDWMTQTRQGMKGAGFSDNEIDGYLGGTVVAPETAPAAFMKRLNQASGAPMFDRLVKATGRGIAEGFGPQPLGDEAMAWMREQGMISDPAKGTTGPLRLLTDALNAPIGVAAEGLVRATNAGFGAFGALAGQLTREVGGSETAAGQAEREAQNLAQYLGIEAGFGRGTKLAKPEIGIDGRPHDRPISAVPTGADFKNAASSIAPGAEVTLTPEPSRVQQKLRALLTEGGMLPGEVAADAQRDPTIAQSLASRGNDLPERYGVKPQPIPGPTVVPPPVTEEPAIEITGMPKEPPPLAAPPTAPVELPPVAPPTPAPAPAAGAVSSYSPGDLLVDADRFQFKAGADEQGVTDRLSGVEAWDPVKAGLALVWEDKDGKRWIVDGHQRLALAKRIEEADPAQQPRLNAITVREADGVSDTIARVQAASKNIAEGTGSAVDAAKVLRDAPALAKELPPRSELVRQARGLASLSDESFRAVINDVVPPQYGAIVGRLAPTDEKLQGALIDLLAKTGPANATQAEAIVRQGIAAGTNQAVQKTLFGDEDVVTSLYLDRARVLDASLKQLKRDKTIFSTLVKESDIVQSVGNRLEASANAQRLAIDQQAAQILQVLANRAGPVSDALGAAARKAAAGDRRGATADFVAAIRRGIEDGSILRGADGLDRGRLDVAGEDAPSVIDPISGPGLDLAQSRTGDAARAEIQAAAGNVVKLPLQPRYPGELTPAEVAAATRSGGLEDLIARREEDRARAGLPPFAELPPEAQRLGEAYARAQRYMREGGPPLSPADDLYAKIAELDLRNAPDADYRGTLSTGARSKERGDTWREKALRFARSRADEERVAAPEAPALAEAAPAIRPYDMTLEQLDKAAERERTAAHARAVTVFGSEERATLFEELERRADSGSPDRADAAIKRLREEFPLTEEQDTFLAGGLRKEGEVAFDADDLKEMRRARDLTEEDSDTLVSSHLVSGLMMASRDEMRDVIEGGQGSVKAQIAAAYVDEALRQFKLRGLSGGQIGDLIEGAMRRRGASAADARELLGEFMGAQRAPVAAPPAPAAALPAPETARPPAPPPPSAVDALRPEYDAAFQRWDKARQDYQAQRIGDEEFLAAKRRFDEIAGRLDEALRREEAKVGRAEPPPTTERTEQGEQIVMPGMERSARQAMQAREEAGRGKIQPTAPQAAPGGLFAPPPAPGEPGFEWGPETGALFWGKPPPPPPGSLEEAEQSILSKMSIGQGDRKRPYTLAKFYTDVFDKLYPINEATPTGTPTWGNPYRLTRLMAGEAGRIEHFLSKGTLDYKTGQINGPSLDEVLKPVRNDLNGFRAFGTAASGLERENMGVTVPLDVAAMRRVVREGIDKYGPILEQFTAFENRVAAYLRDSGVLSERAYDRMVEAHQLHVPFQRVMEEHYIPPGESMTPRNPIHRMKDSDRDINDPLENVIRNTAAAISMADKNEAAKSLRTVLTSAGDIGWARGKAIAALELPPDPVLDAKLRQYLTSNGIVDPEDLLDVLHGAIQHPQERDTFTVFDDGVRRVYRIDPELARAWKGLDAQSAGFVEKMMAPWARVLRAGAVLTPDFQARHTIRDFLYAFVTSPELFTPYDMWKGFFGLAVKDEDYWKWMQGGGANISNVSLDRRYLQESIATLTQKTGIMTRAQNVIADPNASWLRVGGAIAGLPFRAADYYLLQPLQVVTALAENASHLGAFKQATRRLEGENLAAGRAADLTKEQILEAAFHSRDVAVDAARIGARMRAYNMITAFANITLQDSDRVVRAFINDPVSTALKIAVGISIPSALLWLANRNDPRYKEIPQWEKDTFSIIPAHLWQDVGPASQFGELRPGMHIPYRIHNGMLQVDNGAIFRSPKPWGMGVVFGSGVERTLEHWAAGNPEAFHRWGDSILAVAIPNFVPSVFGPVLDQFANRSTFTNRTLIPDRLEKELPEYQYFPYTTEAARKIGEIFGAFPGMRETAISQGPAAGVAHALTSPILLENYLRGWTGTLGMYALTTADAALRKAGVVPDPPMPTATLADIPVIKAFVVRYPTATTESIQDFHDAYARNRVYYQTWIDKAQEGDADAARRVMQLGGPRMFLKFDQIEQALNTHSKLIGDINRNPQMQPWEKRQLIDTIYYRMIELGQIGKEMTQRADKMFGPR
jgi:hypothetical protein